jgi:hypothetical protein
MKMLNRFSLRAAWVRYVTIGTMPLVAAVVLLTVSHQPQVHASESFTKFPHLGPQHVSLTLHRTYINQDDTGTPLQANVITPEDPVTNIFCPAQGGCTLQITESATLNAQGYGSGNGISLNVYLDGTTVAPIVFNETLNDACGGNGCTASGQFSLPITYGPHSVYTLIDAQLGAYLELYENIYQVYAP